MDELMNEAKNELKRVEHLYYVSLKYTRTADVIKNVVERMINAFAFLIDVLLEHAKGKKLVEKIPPAPRARSDLLKAVYPEDEELAKFINFYTLLRDIRSAPYTKREEYRRHVTMSAEISPGEFIEVNIDVLGEYLKYLHMFFDYVKEKILI